MSSKVATVLLYQITMYINSQTWKEQHEHIRNLRGCPHLVLWTQCLGTTQNGVVFSLWVPDIWLCTQLLHFALSAAIFKHELSTENKAVDCPQLTKNVCTWCPSRRSRPCTWSPAPCPNSSLGICKNGCDHISAQWVPYLGTVPGHQVWTLLKAAFTLGAWVWCPSTVLTGH